MDLGALTFMDFFNYCLKEMETNEGVALGYNGRM